MILKQGHTYRAMPHDGKVIRRIYRGGRCYYIASPYSPEATQALKAAFPQYWTAIRNYGVAHPQLVPFINEDPMLIVSLVEVGKTRWLVGDGKAWIDLEYSPNNYTNCNVDAQFTTAPESSTWPCILGACDSGELNRWCIMRHGSNKCFIYAVCDNTSASNQKTVRTNWEDLLPHNFIVNNGEFIIDGVSYGSIAVPTFNTKNRMRVFGENNANKLSARIRPVNIGSCEISDNDTSIHLCPFTRNGENGMLDILSGTFHPNANTQGAFTIELTDKA